MGAVKTNFSEKFDKIPIKTVVVKSFFWKNYKLSTILFHHRGFMKFSKQMHCRIANNT